MEIALPAGSVCLQVTDMRGGDCIQGGRDRDRWQAMRGAERIDELEERRRLLRERAYWQQ